MPGEGGADEHREDLWRAGPGGRGLRVAVSEGHRVEEDLRLRRRETMIQASRKKPVELGYLNI